MKQRNGVSCIDALGEESNQADLTGWPDAAGNMNNVTPYPPIGEDLTHIRRCIQLHTLHPALPALLPDRLPSQNLLHLFPDLPLLIPLLLWPPGRPSLKL